MLITYSYKYRIIKLRVNNRVAFRIIARLELCHSTIVLSVKDTPVIPLIQLLPSK